jgi:hypothetical protein
MARPARYVTVSLRTYRNNRDASSHRQRNFISPLKDPEQPRSTGGASHRQPASPGAAVAIARRTAAIASRESEHSLLMLAWLRCERNQKASVR